MHDSSYCDNKLFGYKVTRCAAQNEREKSFKRNAHLDKKYTKNTHKSQLQIAIHNKPLHLHKFSLC